MGFELSRLNDGGGAERGVKVGDCETRGSACTTHFYLDPTHNGDDDDEDAVNDTGEDDSDYAMLMMKCRIF